MKPIATYLSAALFSGILLIPAPLPAESSAPPSRAVGRFAQNGKIDRVDLKEGIIVVDDRLYKLSSNTRVYTPTGLIGAPDMLKKNTKIGFNIGGSQAPDSRLITEAVVLSPE